MAESQEKTESSKESSYGKTKSNTGNSVISMLSPNEVFPEISSGCISPCCSDENFGNAYSNNEKSKSENQFASLLCTIEDQQNSTYSSLDMFFQYFSKNSPSAKTLNFFAESLHMSPYNFYVNNSSLSSQIISLSPISPSVFPHLPPSFSSFAFTAQQLDKINTIKNNNSSNACKKSRLFHSKSLGTLGSNIKGLNRSDSEERNGKRRKWSSKTFMRNNIFSFFSKNKKSIFPTNFFKNLRERKNVVNKLNENSTLKRISFCSSDYNINSSNAFYNLQTTNSTFSNTNENFYNCNKNKDFNSNFCHRLYNEHKFEISNAVEKSKDHTFNKQKSSNKNKHNRAFSNFNFDLCHTENIQRYAKQSSATKRLIILCNTLSFFFGIFAISGGIYLSAICIANLSGGILFNGRVCGIEQKVGGIVGNVLGLFVCTVTAAIFYSATYS